jgi:hypothetical protein
MKLPAIFWTLTLLVLLVGCKSKTNTSFREITSGLYQFEESNRIDFRSYIEQLHAPISQLSREVIYLYDLMDTVTTNLLVQSGGYAEDGTMIGGSDLEIGKQIISSFKLFEKIKRRMSKIKNDYNSDSYDTALIEELEKSLYIILSDKMNLHTTVSKLYLDILIMQNKILVAETKYFELKYLFEQELET